VIVNAFAYPDSDTFIYHGRAITIYWQPLNQQSGFSGWADKIHCGLRCFCRDSRPLVDTGIYEEDWEMSENTNGKDLVLKALSFEETERVPWVPFVGCHAASLLGMSVKEYSHSVKHIVSGVLKAYDLYQPDGIPVLFDVQLEAEALGCGLQWADDSSPSVTTHPLEDKSAVSSLRIPEINSGRFPVVLEAMQKVSAEIGAECALYSFVTGPLSLALHLRGSAIFTDMFDDLPFVEELLDLTASICQETARSYAAAGMDVVVVVDPITSQISPGHFRRFMSPVLSRIFTYIHDLGRPSSLHACGDISRNLEEMCRCGVMNISFDENMEIEYVRDICSKYRVSFGGNISPVSIMLQGDRSDNTRAAIECIQKGGRQGYLLYPGCDIPYHVPSENIQVISAVVHDQVGPAGLITDLNAGRREESGPGGLKTA